MAGSLSSELAGISGDPANPMRQISGDAVVPAALPGTTSGNGYNVAVDGAGLDITVTLDSGQVAEVLCVLHTNNPAANTDQGDTTRISSDTLTAAVAPSIQFRKGATGADVPWVINETMSFTIMVTDL